MAMVLRVKVASSARGRIDDAGEDHRQDQDGQAGGGLTGGQQAIEADLASDTQHRGDVSVRQAAQHRQPLGGGAEHLVVPARGAAARSWRAASTTDWPGFGS